MSPRQKPLSTSLESGFKTFATTASVVKTIYEVVIVKLGIQFIQPVVYLRFFSQSLGNYQFPTIFYIFYCKIVVVYLIC